MWTHDHLVDSLRFRVHQLPALADNYIYLIDDDQSDALAAVDPAEEAPVLEACEALGKRLGWILNTHHHWDHSGANEALHRATGCLVIGSAVDSARIPALGRAVRESETIRLGALSASVLDVPGHTRGHLAFLIGDALFCGDTLFGAGCGRIFEGTPEQMWASLKRLAALPGSTRVYCAHEYTEANLRFALLVRPDHAPLKERIERVARLRAEGRPSVPSTIAEERATNPFLWPLDADFRREYARVHGLESDRAPVVFAHLRARKDRF